MMSKKVKQITFILILLFAQINLFAQNETASNDSVSLSRGIELLERYFLNGNSWHVSKENYVENVQGLIHFIEDQPIDTILLNLKTDSVFYNRNFVFRLPENVSDSLLVPGYYSATSLNSDIEKLAALLQQKYQHAQVTLPLEVITEIENKVNIIQPGEGIKLFNDSVYILPANLEVPEVIPDSMIHTAEDFQKIIRLDSLREKYIEGKRIAYNDSIVKAYRDSIIYSYRQKRFENEFSVKKKNLTDSVTLNNYLVLKNYNDSIVNAVNDSILIVVNELSEYADFIDTTQLNILNLTDEKGGISLRDKSDHFTRIWLKNEQNDSLSVLVKNLDKNSIKMLIDDGLAFSRFTTKESKDFDFSKLNKTVTGLSNVGKRYKKETPWLLGGAGNAGFTQTYLENWKKGGKSALSLLLVLKGFANYSRADTKVKWENSLEIRDGWIRPGGAESEWQKNDDKFEFTTRGGLSAFKKWYYSAEFNFNTQFFNGYNYPTITNPDPISGFMAPARTFFKIGLDYKPNKSFSLFLSPLTAKNVFVKDTVKIDQTKFGISADKRSSWTPGLNADLTFKKELIKKITYETKYKMFINYTQPFKKFDINWENLLSMELTDYINMQMMIHLIYDDDVLFPIKNEAGDKIGEEARLQLKQFITVGFSYKINRQVTRSKRIHH